MPFLVIRIAILFIIKFELVLLTNPSLLRESCDLYGPSTVAHLHPVIA
jgi:hypothetical protein